MRRYNPKEIEPKWQKIWDESKIYAAKEDKSKPKKYILEYFPYPSGVAMHVGHVRNYTIGDTISRFMRMKGDNVLHPMGWDAFGLPAENFAIKNNVSPKESTEENIKTFKRQLRQLGFSYDWSRELSSTDPDYYKWTQWLFLQFYKKGLAYRAKSLQNWCPTDQTVLANEQVITKDGVNVCERDGTPVIQKEVKQWFLKITDYADRLLDDLEDLDWPEGIKAMQRNWIGKSVGVEIDFELDGHGEKITVFTTRPDTIYGATFLVLAPEHKILNKLSIPENYKKEVEEYISQAKQKTDIERMDENREKSGIFTGLYVINPFSKEKMPIWVADYVLPKYGTGAIMAVPAHDYRDYEFAKKNNLPITQVVAQVLSGVGENKFRPGEKVVERSVAQSIVWHPNEEKLVVLEVPAHKWRTLIMGGIDEGEDWIEGAKREIYEETGYKNLEFIGFAGQELWSEFWALHKNENRIAHFRGMEFRLKDLEQHPTDKSEADMHRIHWLSPGEALEKLTIEEPKYFISSILKSDEFKPFSGEGKLINSGKYNSLNSAEAREKIVTEIKKRGIGREKVNYKLHDWSVSRQRYWGCPIPIIYCDKDGMVPVPDEDLPVILPDNVKFKPTGQSPLQDLPDFVNVKCPKCGEPAKRETDTFDTFIDSSWYFLRFDDPHNQKEAFAKEKVDYWMPVDNYIGGAEHAVVHLLYARFWTKFLKDIDLVSIDEPFKALRNQGMIGGADGRKMGKRYGNVVTPSELINQGYGADALRLYELFIGPYNQGLDWNPRGIAGTYRFLDRLWVLTQEFLETKPSDSGHNSALAVQVDRIINKTIKKVSGDLEDWSFNTAIAALMECVNELYKIKSAHNFELAQTAWREGLIAITQLLAPFAPHIAEELWADLEQSGSVHVSRWPAWDESLITEETITLAVQINGKVRAEIMVTADASEDEVTAAAKADDNVAKYLTNKTVKKVIYVPGRLISFVL